MSRSSYLVCALAALLSLPACGGASSRRPYAAAESPLALDRVVLYRNGIGYFERVGEVDGRVLTLKVRKDQINDLLKSLTVVERGTGRAVSVSMPLDPQTWANAALAALQPGQGSLAEVLDALRGSYVSLSTGDGSISGRIVMVETLVEPPADRDDDRPTTDHRVTLLDGDEMRVVRLSKVRGVELEDGDIAMQLHRTLDASAGEGMFQQVEVKIRLAGATSHDLLVSYVSAAPMWKPTYRVVLPEDGKGEALLQAWAVVDNTSGEDWPDVELGLTSGAPIAFRYDLHTPRQVSRADLTESGVRRRVDAMVGEASYGPVSDSAGPPPSTATGSSASGDDFGGADEKQRSKKSRAPMAPRAEPSPVEAEESRPSIDYESLRRSTQAQARAATISGQTRFDLAERVTVPDGTSTMVAIINDGIEAEETFLYRPGGAGMGYETNPYRVVRFRNTTPFVLEPGPISIYAGGSFVGEGLSETVGSGTSATVPFAVETGIMVTSSARDERQDMHLVKMSRGILEVEQFARRTTTYTARAQTLDDGYSVLIRHAKSGWNYALENEPEGTEILPDGYLIKLSVPAGKREGSLTVVEQTPSRSTISIWNEPALEVLEKLLVHTNLGADVEKKLRPVVERRRALARLEQQIVGLTEKRNKLDQRASELRQNIAAIAKNRQAAAQRQKWTRQLDQFTSEGNKLGAELAALEAKRLDVRIELEDSLQDLELTVPRASK